VTEDDGRVLAVFPGSERLRYTIPFADPQQTIDYLGLIAQRQPNAVVVFGDDGEKFGSWPETKKHVYQDGWLERFFNALMYHQHWIEVTTAGRGRGARGAHRQGVPAQLQLPRDDRMGAAGRAVWWNTSGSATKWSTTRAGLR